MAEGWTRALKRDTIEAFSAGTAPQGLNPHAIQVMREAGIDLSLQRSKHIDEFKVYPLDYLITVCGNAHETCPVFPATCKVIHAGFQDPPQLARELAEQGASEDTQLDCYRKVRDQIKAFVEKLPEFLELQEHV